MNRFKNIVFICDTQKIFTLNNFMFKMNTRQFNENAIKPTYLNSEKKIRHCNDHSSIGFAVDMLISGEIIALPTDTVYGLACNANNLQALQKIYNVKNRIETNPLAICVSDIIQMKKYGQAEHLSDGLLNALLPGPVTLILYKSKSLNPLLNPGEHKIAIRIPNYDFIKAVCKACEFPLALTSANLSSEPSPLSISEFSNLWNKLGAVFDAGNISNDMKRRAASTIIDLSEKGVYKIKREGVALKETEFILNKYGIIKNGF